MFCWQAIQISSFNDYREARDLISYDSQAEWDDTAGGILIAFAHFARGIKKKTVLNRCFTVLIL